MYHHDQGDEEETLAAGRGSDMNRRMTMDDG
jgi:hypothetical protein